MVEEQSRWNDFAETYNEKVFHLTKYDRVRKKILASMQRGIVLDLGCGPRGLLLNAMRACGDFVVGLDFSLAILAKAWHFSPGSLICADSRKLPFLDNTFDSIVAINSILPGKRNDVSAMFREASRTLRVGGKLVAYLPSYDYGTKCVNAGIELRRDERGFREWDTGGWQCTYTQSIVDRLMQKIGFSTWHLEVERFDREEEIKDANRIYGADLSFDFSGLPIEEYFLMATK